MKLFQILVIHGFSQTASIISNNTGPLRAELADVANLTYVEGPPYGALGDSRPWWIFDADLEYVPGTRWQDSVTYWSEELSKHSYDGIIGLSQGSAMTGLLVSMINHPERAPVFNFTKPQPIQFAVFSSGFVSHKSPHKEIYGIPDDLRTLHTVDDNDGVVPPSRTIELQQMCKTSILMHHNEGHAIPESGDWPKTFRNFILNNGTATPSAVNATTQNAQMVEAWRCMLGVLLVFLVVWI